MKKLVTLMVVAIAACCFFTSCDKEDGGRIKKSDILGTWYNGASKYEFYSSGNFDYWLYLPSNYWWDYEKEYEYSGSYEIYPNKKLFVVNRNNGSNDTYEILILNKTTFVYREKDGDESYTYTLRRDGELEREWK